MHRFASQFGKVEEVLKEPSFLFFTTRRKAAGKAVRKRLSERGGKDLLASVDRLGGHTLVPPAVYTELLVERKRKKAIRQAEEAPAFEVRDRGLEKLFLSV